MCLLYAFDKREYKSTGLTDFHSGRPLPEYSNVNPLVSLCVTINYFDTWINTFYNNIALICL